MWLPHKSFARKYSLLSTTLVLLILSLILSVGVYYISQGFDQRYFKYDSWGYYIYLPAFFIYHDALHLHHVAEIMWKYDLSHSFYQALKLPNGNYVFVYTAGVAFFELPFFLLAHFIALAFHLEADGYSAIYRIFIIWSGLFWGFRGVINCYSILRKFFPQTVAVLVGIILVLATNLFNYLFWENGMTHVYSFFLCSFCLLKCIDFVESPSFKNSFIIGFALGLIILIRPTNIIMVIPLLFAGCDFSISGIRERISFLLKHPKYIATASLMVLIPFGLQTLYWKWATGLFLFNSYAYFGFGFDFLHPHIGFGLFSIRKGWFIYTPVMALVMLGLLIRSNKKNALPPLILFIYLFIHIWIVYSWHTYDYGGCFGARAMIDVYPFLCLPLAACIQYLMKNHGMRITLFCFIAICAANNIFQTWKYQKGLLSPDGYMNKEFLKCYFNYDDYNVPSYLSEQFKSDSLSVEKKMELVKPQIIEFNHMYSEGLSLSMNEITGNYRDYFIRIEASGSCKKLNILNGKREAYVIFQQERRGDTYCWKSKPIYSQTINGDSSMQKIVFEKRLIPPFEKNDRVRCYAFNASDNQFELDTIRLFLIKFR